MRTLLSSFLFATMTLLVMAAAFAQAPQESPPLATKHEPQQTPEHAKKEEQKPDTQASATNLAKAVQNPVASLISVPVQNLTDFNIGPYARDRNTVLQFQPVIPFQLGRNWNLITRTIAPVLSQPDITQQHGGTFGLGDINPSFFLSPANPGR
jgi:predicted small lipoprotein YifL